MKLQVCRIRAQRFNKWANFCSFYVHASWLYWCFIILAPASIPLHQSYPWPGFFLLQLSGYLKAFCDADWAGCLYSHHSLIGYCVFLSDSLISWKPKKQSTLFRSSIEAKYRAMASTCHKLTCLVYVIHDLGILVHLWLFFSVITKAALHIVANLVFHEHNKHTDRLSYC